MNTLMVLRDFLVVAFRTLFIGNCDSIDAGHGNCLKRIDDHVCATQIAPKYHTSFRIEVTTNSYSCACNRRSALIPAKYKLFRRNTDGWV
jgi:hypothetical protein